MRVGRTASIASDVMGSKTSFSSAYESTRSESPPSANLFKSQQQTYTSGVSGGNSSNWPGPAYKKMNPTPTQGPPQGGHGPVGPAPAPSTGRKHPDVSRKGSPPIDTKERNLFLKLPRSVALSPARGLNPRSPDLMAGDSANRDVKDNRDTRGEGGVSGVGIGPGPVTRTGTGPLLVTPFYRSNASRSRSRSAGKWRADQSESLDNDNHEDHTLSAATRGVIILDGAAGSTANIGNDVNTANPNPNADDIDYGDDSQIAGGYDTT